MPSSQRFSPFCKFSNICLPRPSPLSFSLLRLQLVSLFPRICAVSSLFLFPRLRWLKTICGLSAVFRLAKTCRHFLAAFLYVSACLSLSLFLSFAPFFLWAFRIPASCGISFSPAHFVRIRSICMSMTRTARTTLQIVGATLANVWQEVARN